MHWMCYFQGYYEIWMSLSLLFRHWMCKLSRHLRNLKDFVIPWIECERLPEISMISRWLQRMKYLGSSPLFQLPKISWKWSNLQAWHSKTDGYIGKITLLLHIIKKIFEITIWEISKNISKLQFWGISKSSSLNNFLNKHITDYQYWGS